MKAKDKNKHFSKRSGTISKATKIEFFWTDDKIQILLKSVNQYWCKCEYEGINWGRVCFKYERIQEIFIDSYSKNSLEGKEFPVLENPEVFSKTRVAAKLKKEYDRIIRKLQTPKETVVEIVLFVFYDLSETIWGGSPAVTSLQKGIDSSSQLIKGMWIVY